MLQYVFSRNIFSTTWFPTFNPPPPTTHPTPPPPLQQLTTHHNPPPYIPPPPTTTKYWMQDDKQTTSHPCSWSSSIWLVNISVLWMTTTCSLSGLNPSSGDPEWYTISRLSKIGFYSADEVIACKFFLNGAPNHRTISCFMWATSWKVMELVREEWGHVYQWLKNVEINWSWWCNSDH